MNKRKKLLILILMIPLILTFIFIKNYSDYKKKTNLLNQNLIEFTLLYNIQDYFDTNFELPSQMELRKIIDSIHIIDKNGDKANLNLYCYQDSCFIRIYDKGFDFFKLKSNKYLTDFSNYNFFQNIFNNYDLQLLEVDKRNLNYKNIRGIILYKSGNKLDKIKCDNIEYKMLIQVGRFVQQQYKIDSLDYINYYPDMERKKIVFKIYKNRETKILFSEFEEELTKDITTYIKTGLLLNDLDSIKIAVDIPVFSDTSKVLIKDANYKLNNK